MLSGGGGVPLLSPPQPLRRANAATPANPCTKIRRNTVNEPFPLEKQVVFVVIVLSRSDRSGPYSTALSHSSERGGPSAVKSVLKFSGANSRGPNDVVRKG